MSTCPATRHIALPAPPASCLRLGSVGRHQRCGEPPAHPARRREGTVNVPAERQEGLLRLGELLPEVLSRYRVATR